MFIHHFVATIVTFIQFFCAAFSYYYKVLLVVVKILWVAGGEDSEGDSWNPKI